jgi:hypothetical protein
LQTSSRVDFGQSKGRASGSKDNNQGSRGRKVLAEAQAERGRTTKDLAKALLRPGVTRGGLGKDAQEVLAEAQIKSGAKVLAEAQVKSGAKVLAEAFGGSAAERGDRKHFGGPEALVEAPVVLGATEVPARIKSKIIRKKTGHFNVSKAD